MAEFRGAIHEAGRPVLRSLQPLYLLARQSVEQRISSVNCADYNRLDKLFRRSTGQVTPDHCNILKVLQFS